MVSLNNAEKGILMTLQSLAMTCGKYEDNFEDDTLRKIKDTYIEPVIVNMGAGLVEAFGNLAPMIKEMQEKDILDED